MTDLKDKLLKEIKSGDVAMTPRVYFTLHSAALLATALAVLVVTVFILNFIFFSIRINSHDALLHFGPHGFGAFLRFFPWHLLILDIGLVMLLQWLLRHFRFGYKVPVLYLVAALLVGAGVFGLVIDRATPLNDRLHEGRDRLPPPVRSLYSGAQKPPMGSAVCRCTILKLDGSILTVADTRDPSRVLTIELPMHDRYATSSGLSVGDVVFIAGEEDDGLIRAFGVRKEGGVPRGFGVQP